MSLIRALRDAGPWREFIETPVFTDYIVKLLDDAEYGLLQRALLERPDTGSIIRGTGGARKIRWAAKGRGKSGGVRVIYYPFESATRQMFLMLLIYSKSEKESLTDSQKSAIKMAIDLMKKELPKHPSIPSR